MKGLPTLIKLRQRELDTLRRNVAKLEEELEKLVKEEKRLQAELRHEKQLASEQPEMAQFFGDFAQGNEQKQDQLRELQKAVNKEIESMREKVAEAFGELKRLEITQEKLLAELEEEQKHREQQELDEIGLQQHRRQEKETQDE